MSKENGRETERAGAPGMVIQGHLTLLMSGTKIRELAEGKVVRLELGKSREFNLEIKPAPADGIEHSNLWFDVDSAKVEIDNCIRADHRSGETTVMLYDYLAVTLRESANSELGFCLTPAQAKALVAVLMRYVEAWQACDALRGEPARA